MEGMAYGAGKAGGAFNPITFFQQPHTILRILSWNACNYGLFMGILAFLCCLAFLALDVYFPQISSVKDRKKAVLADVGVSAQSFFGYQRYKLGADSALFSQDYIDPSLDAGAAGDPYTSFTAGGDDLEDGDPVGGSSYQGINGKGGGGYQEY
ncbi:unnamed protein product [Coregonus sp. 'balchen']|nr:unnamed protein product [Coregonus sp. 'balchen']